MKLSKALRVKNQLIHKMNKLQSNIIKNNSYNIKNPPKWDINESFKMWSEGKAKLLELKTMISLANRPIVSMLHHIAEAKAEMKFLSDIPTKEGVFKDNYSDKELEYACTIDEISKAGRIDTLTESIYTCEDTLAKHNASTDIDFVL